ncbi:MAG: hypothetical protein HBSAPP03_20570 [Phycisphaerae bacterium]|nr:MAG: hypothetical protein HBSAPP03_20570 [Phycisphaerae bacterium]
MLVALAGVLPACGTHGKFTGNHLSAAKLRMAELKSATEYQMAHQAYLATDLPKALKHVEYSLELNPPVVKSHILKGRILMEMSNLEAAAIAFRRAEELDPKNVDAWYYQGLMAERLDRKEEALRRYAGAANLDGTNPQYPIAAAEILVAMDQIDAAEQLLTEGLTKFEHSAGVRQTLGHIAMLKDNPEKAAKHFGEARLLDPEDDRILEDLAGAQIACGKFAQAESNLAHLLNDKKHADRRDLLRLRAKCLAQINRPVECRDILLRLTKTTEGTSDFEAWSDLGRVSVELRDYSRVKDAAARCLGIDPTRPEGYVLRGLEQRSRGDHASSANAFAQAVERGRTADNLILLGLSLQDLGRADDARTCFEAALRLSPNHPIAAKLLASAQ